MQTQKIQKPFRLHYMIRGPYWGGWKNDFRDYATEIEARQAVGTFKFIKGSLRLLRRDGGPSQLIAKLG